MKKVPLLYNLSVLKSERTLDELAELLKTALSKCWNRQTRALLMELLSEVRALGERAAATPGDVGRIEAKAAKYLGVGLAEAARRPVAEAISNSYRHGLHGVGVDFALKAPDLSAIDLLREDGLYWLGGGYDRFASDAIRKSLWAYYETGATRLQLAEHLEDSLSQLAEPKMKGYFNLLADHWVARTNELGRVAGYEEAGVEYVQVVAVLDAHTTQICRSMHGRTIPVGALSRQRDRLLSAARRHDADAMKAAQPMFGDQEVPAATKTSALIDAGIGLPPYHFRCRTTTVAYFPPVEYPEKVSQWAIDGEVPAKELPGLLDYAMKCHWGSHKATWKKQDGGDGLEHPTAFVHYMKHGKREFHATMAEYNEQIASLIRRGGRDAYLIIEDKKAPHPQIVFHDTKTGEQAIISLEGQTISTFFKTKKFRFRARAQVVMPLPKMKGVMKTWTPKLKRFLMSIGMTCALKTSRRRN
ncbi:MULTISPECIES: hypothetical protein [unclassified Pyramidobacter]|uniref:hypothetical protein n=1 Tax=unclassified Pyramidobacter TaxID=2632171 RepID=UPI000EA18090|nr:hypothetical protein [Pyramidobacter sp. CG50-2]RKJ80551.1 hypothetical protein D7D26_02975 [Pyramidobacter sp. CG50-2]